MRIIKDSLIQIIKKEKIGRKYYFYYKCLCGETGKTRSDYVAKIKSCAKCQHKNSELITDPNKLWCGKCQKIKDKIEFNIRKDGTKRSCRKCEAQYNKDNCLKHKEHTKKWQSLNPEKRLFFSAKNRAKTNNLDFNIELSDIIIPEFCPVLGIKLDKYRQNNNKEHSPSLDRIDSNKGYIKGNICVISWRANWLKNNGSKEEFEAIINYLDKSRR
jgi:hypothetical protein